MFLFLYNDKDIIVNDDTVELQNIKHDLSPDEKHQKELGIKYTENEFDVLKQAMINVQTQLAEATIDYYAISDSLLIRDRKGWTPLHFAVATSHPFFINQIISHLIIKGINRSVSLSFRTKKEGYTLIMIAILLGYEDLVKSLFQIGASLYEKDYFNRNIIELSLISNNFGTLYHTFGGAKILWMAVYFNMEYLVDKLLNLSIAISLEVRLDERYGTPLLLAIELGHMTIVDKLIKAGANMKVQNNMGYGIIHIASKKKYSSQFLLYLLDELHMHPDTLSLPSKKTPLHVAMENGCVENVIILIEHGANRRIKDKKGLIPNQLARKNRQKEMMYYIHKVGTKALENLIDEVGKSDYITFPYLDIDDECDPPEVWIQFLASLYSNPSPELTLDTSNARLSTKQVSQIVTTLRNRLHFFPDKSACTYNICGMKIHPVYSAEISLIISNPEFSLQKLAHEISTKHHLTKKQKLETEPFYTQIISFLLLLITMPIWLLCGLFEFLTNYMNGNRNIRNINSFECLFGQEKSYSELNMLRFNSFYSILFCIAWLFFSISAYTYPLLIYFKLYHYMTEPFYSLIIIGLYLIFIVIPLLIELKIIWNDPFLLRIEFPQKEITTLSFRNGLAFFSVFLDFYQLSALSFITNRFKAESGFETIFRISILRFTFLEDDLELKSTIGVVVALVVIWLLICSFIFYAAYNKQPFLLHRIPKLNLAVTIVSNTLFITITSKLFSIIDCTINTDTNISSLDINSNMQCWNNIGSSQMNYAFSAFILLTLYVWSSNLICPFFQQSFRLSLEAHTFVAFSTTERLLKLFVSCVSVLLSNHNYRYLNLFSLLFANLFILILVIRYKPCDNTTLNQLKIIFAMMASFGVFCSILGESYGERASEVWFPFILLITGWSVMFTTWFIFWIMGRINNKFLWGFNEEIHKKHDIFSNNLFFQERTLSRSPSYYIEMPSPCSDSKIETMEKKSPKDDSKSNIDVNAERNSLYQSYIDEQFAEIFHENNVTLGVSTNTISTISETSEGDDVSENDNLPPEKVPDKNIFDNYEIKKKSHHKKSPSNTSIIGQPSRLKSFIESFDYIEFFSTTYRRFLNTDINDELKNPTLPHIVVIEDDEEHMEIDMFGTVQGKTDNRHKHRHHHHKHHSHKHRNKRGSHHSKNSQHSINYLKSHSELDSSQIKADGVECDSTVI